MLNSITETLKKINIDLKGSSFISIVFLLIILNVFLGFKIIEADNFNKNTEIKYIKANSDSLQSEGAEIEDSKDGFIYASKKGKKYYFYNCKSSIKEENKTYFNTEDEAKDSGYTLSSGCK